MFVDDIRRFCGDRFIEQNTYYSVLLSLINDKITIFDNADKDLVEILCKEIVDILRRKYVVDGVDFKNIV